jgi:hypothetical protein
MDKSEEWALQKLAQTMDLDLPTGSEARLRLQQHINELIQNDFNRLLTILYRIDVDEDKLKAALRGQPNRDAAEIICEMMIERQAGKRGER